MILESSSTIFLAPETLSVFINSCYGFPPESLLHSFSVLLIYRTERIRKKYRKKELTKLVFAFCAGISFDMFFWGFYSYKMKIVFNCGSSCKHMTTTWWATQSSKISINIWSSDISSINFLQNYLRVLFGAYI